MNKEFQTLRKKQRFSLRKLNIGVASVLLGFTIFGYNLISQAPVAHAATSTVTTASAGSGASGSSATGVVSGSQASNSQAASPTGSAATDSKAASETQVTAPAASQSSESANSGNATSSQASQAGTVSANHTAIGTMPSSQTVSVNETTSSATQARTLMRTLMTNLAVINPDTAENTPNSGTDTKLLPTTQKYDKVEQPLLYDYGLHVDVKGNRDGKTWVNKNLYWYRDTTLDTIFGRNSKLGIITSHPDKYFFAAYVDYSEKNYHRVILLARGQDSSDKNLYSYTIHTYTQNHSTTTTKPGESIKEQYTGAGGSKYDLIFKNYGDSFTVKLNGFEGGRGLLPVFDGGLLDPTYGSNTYDQNYEAAQTKSIGFWASAIPQETSTKVRYVDQATGKDIVQPMEISGFGYQGFKVKGDAPTVKGYHLVSKPEFLPSTNKASTYEDGTISPYEVGQTYDLALSDSVVIKQTVIDTNGTVRATPYYNGSPLTNASKVLGRESYNDHMSFGTPGGKYYTYTNRIGQVNDSYIYYYAKDNDPKGSEMRLHFIDVTGVNNSSYAPSDGPELVDKVQTIHGNIGDKYGFTYTVPTNYYEVGSSDVTGTYSGTHHDAYVYVKIDRNGAKATIEKLTHLNHAQKQAAEAAIDQATDLNTMNQATSTATTLDGDMGDLQTAVNQANEAKTTNNYLQASVDKQANLNSAVQNAQAVLAATGANDSAKQVKALTKSVNDAVDALDGDANTKKQADQNIDDVAKAAKQAIDKTSGLTDDQKQTAKDQIDKAVDAAKENIKKASDNTGVADATDAGKLAIDKVSAKAAIDQALNKKTSEINGANNLDQTTKDKLLQDATDAADAAKNAIGQATTADAIKKAQDDGVSNVNNVKVPSLEDAKKAAKDAVDQAAGKQKDLINKSNNLSDSEKQELNKQVDSATQTAKDAIDGATTNDGATKAGQDGKTAIEQVVPTSLEDAKKAAKDAVDQAAKAKNDAIDDSNLTDEEKDTLKKKVADEVKIAKDNIDAATKDADVTAAQTNGEKAINAVEIPTSPKTKNDANSDLDNTADAAKKAINKTSGLTDDQKQTAKDQIDQAVAAAKENINKASDDTGVAAATDAGKLAIDKVSAKAAIDAAVAAKKSEIAQAPLTAEEAKPLNNLVDQDAAAAKAAIDAATTSAAVETAKNNGVETINNIKVPTTSATKDDANKVTDAGNITPTVPGGKVTVKDPSHLTDDEKNQVKNNVDNANKDKFPGGTDVKVGDDGTTTVTYPDGSKDTIPGDQLVQGQKGDTTDAGKITPTVSGDKVTVKDPSHLTDSEKDQVKTNVTDANKDNLPSGSQITVGNDGTTTVTYPDGSKDTIPGSDLVRQSTDADKTTPSVPETKVPVADPSHLTDSEKDQVKTNVTDANKDNLPSGSQITVGNDGTTTVTYPDGSKDTIPGDKVLEGKSDAKSDADKNEPKEPGDKVKVDDPNKLTDSEKEELSNNLEKLNPGTVVTIADDGTATLTYPDGSTNTIPGSQLVTAKGNGNTTNSNVKVKPTNTNNKINKDNNSLGKNTANAKAGELPQTGETNDSQKLSVIGMALMGILGLFGLGKKRKKD